MAYERGARKYTDHQLLEALRVGDWNVPKTAVSIGISRQGLHRRLPRLRRLYKDTYLEKKEQEVPMPEFSYKKESTNHGGLQPIIVDCTADLSTYIPKPYEGFIERKSWLEFVSILRHTTLNIFKVGEAGVGKTLGVLEAGARLNLPVHNISMEKTMEPKHLFATQHAGNKDGTLVSYFQLSLMVPMIRVPCIIYLDELNFADGKLLSSLHKLLEERKLYIPELDRTFDIHPEVRFVASGNPSDGKYSGTSRMNVALANRFGAVINVEPLTKKDVKAMIGGTQGSSKKAKTESLNTLNSRTELHADIVEQVADFTLEVMKLIEDKNWRTEISFRTVKAMIDLWEFLSLDRAISLAVVNQPLLTASAMEAEAIRGIANGKFPRELQKLSKAKANAYVVEEEEKRVRAEKAKKERRAKESTEKAGDELKEMWKNATQQTTGGITQARK